MTKDQEFLKTLSSTYGEQLATYLHTLCDKICDVREGSYSPEARKAAVEIIERELIDPLLHQNPTKGQVLPSFR